MAHDDDDGDDDCQCGAFIIRHDSPRLFMGGKTIFENGKFALDPEKEKFLVEHMQKAQITTEPMVSGKMIKVPFPPHGNNVQIEVDLAQPQGESITVFGSDLTYDYVTENADYRS